MQQSSLSSSPVGQMDFPINCGRPTVGTAEALLDDPELERLLLRLHSSADLPDLWSATRTILDALIPNDAALMYVRFLNFSQGWEASRVFATPKAHKPAGWMQRRRMVDIMPPYILNRPSLPAFRISDVMTDPTELRNTELFRKYMEPEGWHHSASVLFWQEGSRLHSEIVMRRTESHGDFTPGEMALLSRLRPHFNTVLDRIAKMRSGAEAPLALRLERDRRLRNSNPRARLGVAADEISGNPTELVRLAGGARAERQAETPIPKRAAFSDKERLVLRLAVGGVSNGEISKCLGVTTHTVKWHLANIYSKLGVKNRTAAVSAALAMGIV
jgi:DNA-binding CsgD family transcriptional regulator